MLIFRFYIDAKWHSIYLLLSNNAHKGAIKLIKKEKQVFTSLVLTRKRPLLPQPILNWLLLQFPFLYRTNVIKYESYLKTNNGIEDLLTILENVLTLEGNIIECGSARCGTTVIIANYLLSNGINNKRVYALDLFGSSSFDINELEDDRRLGLTHVSNKVFTYNSYEDIKRKIERLGLANTIIPIRGYFKDTLPNVDSRFCLAFIDCDLKESILYCANTIWPNLSKDGIMLFDDYPSKEYRGARVAVDDFADRHRTEIAEHGMLYRLYYIRKDH